MFIWKFDDGWNTHIERTYSGLWKAATKSTYKYN